MPNLESSTSKGWQHQRQTIKKRQSKTPHYHLLTYSMGQMPNLASSTSKDDNIKGQTIKRKSKTLH